MSNTLKTSSLSDIPLEIVYTARKKTIAIQVLNNQIRVLAPKRTSMKYIHTLIDKRKAWIIEQIHTQEARLKLQRKNYAHGENIVFWGKEYMLQIFHSSKPADYSNSNTSSHLWDEFSDSMNLTPRATVRLVHNTLEIHASKENLSKESIRSILVSWYKNMAIKTLIKRTHLYSNLLKVQPSNIIVKDYKSRWGACAINKTVSYNWKIILAPIEIIDYLIIHELCHILEHNHSSRFWAHVELMDPKYKTHRKWLREHGYKLEI